MITRIFRAKVPAHLHGDFERDFLLRLPIVQAAKGVVSVSIGRPTRWQPDEYVMVSVWENEAAVRAFAGENWNLAVIPREMEQYMSECWVHHFENFGS